MVTMQNLCPISGPSPGDLSTEEIYFHRFLAMSQHGTVHDGTAIGDAYHLLFTGRSATSGAQLDDLEVF